MYHLRILRILLVSLTNIGNDMNTAMVTMKSILNIYKKHTLIMILAALEGEQLGFLVRLEAIIEERNEVG